MPQKHFTPTKARSLALLALGATAAGVVTVGAMAIGAVAIGALAVGRARIKRLDIDELNVRRITFADETGEQPQRLLPRTQNEKAETEEPLERDGPARVH